MEIRWSEAQWHDSITFDEDSASRVLQVSVDGAHGATCEDELPSGITERFKLADGGLEVECRRDVEDQPWPDAGEYAATIRAEVEEQLGLHVDPDWDQARQVGSPRFLSASWEIGAGREPHLRVAARILVPLRQPHSSSATVRVRGRHIFEWWVNQDGLYVEMLAGTMDAIGPALLNNAIREFRRLTGI